MRWQPISRIGRFSRVHLYSPRALTVLQLHSRVRTRSSLPVRTPYAPTPRSPTQTNLENPPRRPSNGLKICRGWTATPGQLLLPSRLLASSLSPLSSHVTPQRARSLSLVIFANNSYIAFILRKDFCKREHFFFFVRKLGCN